MPTNRISSVGELIAQLRTWHRQKRSGSLEVIANPKISWSWRIFLFEGKLIWLAGGPDHAWRWNRHLQNFLPLSSISLSQPRISFSQYREYLILAQLHQQGYLTTSAVAQLRQIVLVERFFDLFQYIETNPFQYIEIIPQVSESHLLLHRMPPLKLSGLSPDEVYFPAWTTWRKWVKAGLKGVFPDYFVVVACPSIIFSQAETAIQQLIDQYVDGTRTLRQISAKSEQDLLTLSQALMPLLEAGGLSLSPTPRLRKLRKLERPNENILTQEPKLKFAAEVTRTFARELLNSVNSGPLIAGVDDSNSFCWILKDILTHAGFRFVSIPDPLKAPSTLLQTKPALILLDLLMPQINGYQLCSHLRQVTALKNTPIIFLTTKDGIIDRVRAKMVGGNGYLTKPITAEKLLGVVTQHLPYS